MYCFTHNLIWHFALKIVPYPIDILFLVFFFFFSVAEYILKNCLKEEYAGFVQKFLLSFLSFEINKIWLTIGYLRMDFSSENKRDADKSCFMHCQKFI